MREGHGSAQTWCMMKQLLLGRFLSLDYEQYIFMLIIDVHMIIEG